MDNGELSYDIDGCVLLLGERERYPPAGPLRRRSKIAVKAAWLSRHGDCRYRPSALMVTVINLSAFVLFCAVGTSKVNS